MLITEVAERFTGIQANTNITNAQPKDYTSYKIAAVMVLFYNDNHNQVTVITTRRSPNLSTHAGDWVFPGGIVEPSDKTLLDTALRETEEEIGIHRRYITFWSELAPEATISKFLVFPFTGQLTKNTIHLDEREVSEVFKLPLSELHDYRNYRRLTFINDVKTAQHTRIYAYNGKVIWGATARILDQIVTFTKPLST